MKLAFLGAGKMATAIAVGMRKGGMLSDCDVTACDVKSEACQAFTAATGLPCSDFDPAVFADADCILIAVKPQVAEPALRALPELKPNQLAISIAAGLPVAKLAAWLGTTRVIRVMPNTPLMVGMGATVFSRGPGVTDRDAELAERLFGASGYVCELPETQLDGVTALSGSGPAYVFEMVQALVDAAVSIGLPADTALKLVQQTVAGAAEMLRQELGTPDELRQAVTSPGGTTAAGLRVLAEADFRAIIRATVEAARDRSIELGRAK